MNQETQVRAKSQKERILNALRDAGAEGVLNTQMSSIALRYNARIQELYVMGYKIDSIELQGGITQYILREEPLTTAFKPQKAEEIMIDDIINKYNNNITSEQISQYLEEHGFTIRRKMGSFC